MRRSPLLLDDRIPILAEATKRTVVTPLHGRRAPSPREAPVSLARAARWSFSAAARVSCSSALSSFQSVTLSGSRCPGSRHAFKTRSARRKTHTAPGGTWHGMCIRSTARATRNLALPVQTREAGCARDSGWGPSPKAGEGWSLSRKNTACLHANPGSAIRTDRSNVLNEEIAP
jgi:hypothetical protein